MAPCAQYLPSYGSRGVSPRAGDRSGASLREDFRSFHWMIRGIYGQSGQPYVISGFASGAEGRGEESTASCASRSPPPTGQGSFIGTPSRNASAINCCIHAHRNYGRYRCIRRRRRSPRRGPQGPRHPRPPRHLLHRRPRRGGPQGAPLCHHGTRNNHRGNNKKKPKKMHHAVVVAAGSFRPERRPRRRFAATGRRTRRRLALDARCSR